jgi:hypothetical protein
MASFCRFELVGSQFQNRSVFSFFFFYEARNLLWVKAEREKFIHTLPHWTCIQTG